MQRMHSLLKKWLTHKDMYIYIYSIYMRMHWRWHWSLLLGKQVHKLACRWYRSSFFLLITNIKCIHAKQNKRRTFSYIPAKKVP